MARYFIKEYNHDAEDAIELVEEAMNIVEKVVGDRT